LPGDARHNFSVIIKEKKKRRKIWSIYQGNFSPNSRLFKSISDLTPIQDFFPGFQGLTGRHTHDEVKLRLREVIYGSGQVRTGYVDLG